LTDLILTLIPLGLFVALSPVPIVAVILLLGTKHPIINALAFTAGWIAVIVAIGAIGLATLSAEDFHHGSGASRGVAAFELVAGIALLFLALRRARSAPAAPPDDAKPHWMSRVEGLNPATALIAGAAFFLVNIGDVIVAVAATVSILKAEVSLSLGESIAALAVFAFVGSLTLLLPVALYAATPERAAAVLDRCKAWLSVPQNTVTAVIVLIGVLLVINGIRGLT
jgi:hypothetical protein